MKTTIMLLHEFLSDNEMTVKTPGDNVTIRICRKLLTVFESAEDPRMSGKVVYRMNELIVMIFLAVLAGADSCGEMSLFWQTPSHIRVYRRLFKGRPVPSHDTFRRILGMIRPEDIGRMTSEILLEADASLRRCFGAPAVKRKQICVDGKVVKGSGRSETESGHKRPLQILNVYDRTTDTCLYSDPIEEKTNEIPHAQKILGEMSLKNTVVSFDAMNTQVKTIEVIVRQKGDYIGGLKGNQGTLYDMARGLFSRDRLAELRKEVGSYVQTREIAHNQYEEREFYMQPLTPKQKRTDWSEWKGVHGIVRFEKTTVNNVTGKKSTETRYYITSLKDIGEAAECIRGHWAVENNLHHGLDTVLYEDHLELSDRTAALNRSIISKMCLSIYRKYQEVMGGKDKISKKGIRKCIGWEFESQMKDMLTLIDPIAMRKCLATEPKSKVAKG